MRPLPGWPRDDGDNRDGLLPQDDAQAPRHWDLGASSSASPARLAGAHRDNDYEADGGPRFLTSAALVPDSRPGGDGQAILDHHLSQSDDDDDSTDDPAHYLQRLSIPPDHDLDASDSDGGVPLNDTLVATALFTSTNPPNFDPDLDLDSDGIDPRDWYTDADDDDGHDDQPSALYPNIQEHNSQLLSLFSLNHDDASALIMDDEFLAPWVNDPLTPVLPGDLPHQAPIQAFTHQPPSFFDDFDDAFSPLQPSNPNPAILGSENLGLVDFLRDWAHRGCFSSGTRPKPPQLHQLYSQARAAVRDVTYAHLSGDDCDYQGMDWTSMQTTREDARIRRRRTYKNYVNRAGSDKRVSGTRYRVLPLGVSEQPLTYRFRQQRPEDRRIAPRDSFFRFRKMTFRPDVSLAHFQLRSVLASPSRTRAYYSSPKGITRINLASKETDLVLNLHEFPSTGGVISTLDAAHGVLMGGTFNGDYCIQSLDSEEGTAFSEGQISPDGITNHLSIHTPRRSSRPVASIASNDRGFRIMDIETEKLISQTMYDFALNCSACSPDRRLRVLVGDDPKAVIVNADTGETLQELAGHQDYGFACDWSDDGWTVATGFQDKAVKIWDARRWCNSSGLSTPLCTIRSEMAGVRGLRFSPLGSGRPILAAAEEADFINLIDARTFATKQTIDVFSEIGGLAFANDGQDLNVLCCDAHRGGLLQLERCGGGPDLLPTRAWTQSRPWLADGGPDGPWPDEWSRNRQPTLLEGPEPF